MGSRAELDRAEQALSELGPTPDWVPPQRNGNLHWGVSTHYFPSYAKRQQPLPSNSPDGQKGSDPGNLIVVVNRYTPRKRRDDGITLILAHSMGTHKETWEPTISHLLSLVENSHGSAVRVSEIWAIEPVHHGDSAVLNREAGISADSLNYPVDVIELAERRLPLPDTDFDEKIPFLPRHPVTRRLKLVAIGHSIGGTALVQAALHSPNTFSGLVLVEPLLSHPEAYIRKAFTAVSTVLAKKQETFECREALVQHIKKNPVYAGWDPEIIQLYLQHGIYHDAAGQLCLKVQSAHEALLASDRHNYQSACYALPSLPLTLPVFFVYGSKSRLLPRWSQVKTSKLPALTESVWVDAGHLVAQEKPVLLADKIHDYLSRNWHVFSSSTTKL